VKKKKNNIEMSIIEQLTESFRCLPGVGPKTAQRLVYHFLKSNRLQALRLAEHIEQAMRTVVQCESCNNFCTEARCSICKNPHRNQSLLCIIEHPSDLLAIEQSQVFNGYYFILTAKISPLDGIGVEQLHLDKLERYLQANPVQEVVIALTPSIETQATLLYLQQLLAHYPHVKITQLAQGVPSGSELQFLDPFTIGTAIRNRSPIE
jgi:recombination protein RecR